MSVVKGCEHVTVICGTCETRLEWCMCFPIKFKPTIVVRQGFCSRCQPPDEGAEE